VTGFRGNSDPINYLIKIMTSLATCENSDGTWKKQEVSVPG